MNNKNLSLGRMIQPISLFSLPALMLSQMEITFGDNDAIFLVALIQTCGVKYSQIGQ